MLVGGCSLIFTKQQNNSVFSTFFAGERRFQVLVVGLSQTLWQRSTFYKRHTVYSYPRVFFIDYRNKENALNWGCQFVKPTAKSYRSDLDHFKGESTVTIIVHPQAENPGPPKTLFIVGDSAWLICSHFWVTSVWTVMLPDPEWIKRISEILRTKTVQQRVEAAVNSC